MADRATYIWTPANLHAGLVDDLHANVQDGQGTHLRIYPFGGWWHVRSARGDEAGRLDLAGLCRWLNDHGGKPINEETSDLRG